MIQFHPVNPLPAIPAAARADGARAHANGDPTAASTPLARPADGNTNGQLAEADLAQIRSLQNRDREVRTHERAHAAAAAGIAHSPPGYSYTRGPDGRMYATGGEVRIDTAPVKGDPHATLAKAQQIQRAALAPASPSATDRAVAAQASAMAAGARAEIAEMRGRDDSAAATPGAPGEPADTASAPESTTDAARCAVCGGPHGGETHLQPSYGQVANITSTAHNEAIRVRV